MKYGNTLIAVKDMKKSLEFYKNLFDQKVTVDLGACKSLTCGLTLQERFDEIAGFPAASMNQKFIHGCRKGFIFLIRMDI